MSVTAVPLRPLSKGTIPKFWIGILLVILLGVGLAWIGTASQQVSTTPSGLRYRVIEAGTGPTITQADLVGLEMEGRTADGTVFHRSQPGQPDVLSTAGLIPGMSEAMLMMRDGGQYQLWIPPELAYGATPPPQSGIQPNATLEFRVRVIGVLAGMAAMQGMMGGAGGPGGGPGGPGGAPGGPMPGGPGGPGGPLPGGPGGPEGAPPPLPGNAQ